MNSESKVSINTNTGISIGIVVVLLGGFAVVVRGLNDNKTETALMKSELSAQAVVTKNELLNKVERLEGRMATLESARSSWTATDMFKWAVHLQQANPQIKVPEPEVNTK